MAASATSTFTGGASSWWSSSDSSIFLLFMLLWVIYGLLNQLNAINGIRFDPTTVVWSQEVLKIIVSIILFFVQDGGGPRILMKEAREQWKLIFWYAIPAGLYALADVLTYVNLRSFDPATLQLLSEMKLVVTAVVHQLLFQRMLTRWHWIALVVITSGCVIKALDSMEVSSEVVVTASEGSDNSTSWYDDHSMNWVDDDDGEQMRILLEEEPPKKLQHPTAFNYVLILIHILISTVASVYNEKLLKDKPMTSINLQNICLYIDGMLFLTIGIAGGLSEQHSSLSEALSPSALGALFAEPSVLAMACTMAIAGIVTSRFLKAFDSIRKSVAVALVVVSLPFLSRIFFGMGITMNMVASMFLVVMGMFIYTAQPPPIATCTPNDSVCVSTSDEVELCLSTSTSPSGVNDSEEFRSEEIELDFIS